MEVSRIMSDAAVAGDMGWAMPFKRQSTAVAQYSIAS